MKKNSMRSRPAAWRPTLIAALAVMAALAGAALLAACGGSHPSAAGGSTEQPSRQQVDVFAQCMRSHGLTNFYLSSPNSKNPDPGELAIGFLPYGVVYGMDVSSPQYQSASSACGHLLPGGGEPPPVTAAQLRSLDRAAACMRAHGFPDYPDPVLQNGHLVPNPLPTGIDMSSPQFQAAVKTCGNPGLG
jgi:hypothetical protein